MAFRLSNVGVYEIISFVILQALDMHMAVAILRVEKGLDYTRFLGEDLQQTFTEESRPIQPNDSTTDLLANVHVHGSNESLSRNISQGTHFQLNPNTLTHTSFYIFHRLCNAHNAHIIAITWHLRRYTSAIQIPQTISHLISIRQHTHKSVNYFL